MGIEVQERQVSTNTQDRKHNGKVTLTSKEARGSFSVIPPHDDTTLYVHTDILHFKMRGFVNPLGRQNSNLP
jgi:hypothetical protein